MPTSDLAPADRGCLLVADISGYTEYLLGTELEHAQDVLADLLETVVGGLEPVFRLSKLEGDAAFAYVLDGSFGPSTLLDAVERSYFAFRARLRDVDHATSCDCEACRLIPSLDLKLILHDGAFVRRAVAGREELTGSDVVLVHRLLKNRAAETLGTGGYLLLTDSCAARLGIDPAALGYAEHAERYDDVGEVRCWLDDLGARWRAESERRREYVPAGEADFEVAVEVPAAPPVAWDYLTAPGKRVLWQADRLDQNAPGGRAGPGTTNHCIHGKDVVVEEVLDWRPFRYYTVRYRFPVGGALRWTFELEPSGTGTRIAIRGERVGGLRRIPWPAVRRVLVRQTRGNGDRLAALLGTVAADAPAGSEVAASSPA